MPQTSGVWAARPEEIRSDDNWESQGPATPPGRLHLTGSLPLTGRKWLVVGLAVVVLAGVGVGSWFLLKPKTATTQSSSRTVQATMGTRTLTVALDGTLAPRLRQ